mmetsp:Transcript_14349/g.34701  ORF Transcript_14349/g.34701 Transcript_14349/m.34701 type:complete len:253 (+) Transcript_14349:2830-3588(+)
MPLLSPGLNISNGSRTKLIAAATNEASNGIFVSPKPRKAPSATTIKSTAGAAHNRADRYAMAGSNNDDDIGTPIVFNAHGPADRNTHSTNSPNTTPRDNEICTICGRGSSSVSLVGVALPTNDVVAVVVARKALNARWKIDVHAPNAASSVGPTRPTYAVSINDNNGSANIPINAGTANSKCCDVQWYVSFLVVVVVTSFFSPRVASAALSVVVAFEVPSGPVGLSPLGLMIVAVVVVVVVTEVDVIDNSEW